MHGETMALLTSELVVIVNICRCCIGYTNSDDAYKISCYLL